MKPLKLKRPKVIRKSVPKRRPVQMGTTPTPAIWNRAKRLRTNEFFGCHVGHKISTATILKAPKQLRYVKITTFCRFYISAMNKYMQ